MLSVAATTDDVDAAYSTPTPCNVTAWDQICPPTPSHWETCGSCCKAHTAQLVHMNCDGPSTNWNYSWSQHCKGKRPPPWHPPPPPPPASPSAPIQYSDVQILLPQGATAEQSTVCGKPIAEWQKQGFLKTVSVSTAPSVAEVVNMAWAVLEGGHR